MSALRQCCEICFSPNTVSKFVRIFPRAAVFFILLHVGIMIYTLASGIRNSANTESETQKFGPLNSEIKQNNVFNIAEHIPRLMPNNTKEHKKRKKKHLRKTINKAILPEV